MTSSDRDRLTSPSPTLLKFAETIVSSGGPILDSACGFGRNAIALAELSNSEIVAVDRDIRRLQILEANKRYFLGRSPVPEGRRISTVCADLAPDKWPFSPSSFGAIICVHFAFSSLIPAFLKTLKPRGLLYLETFGGHGENYLALPKKGEIKLALQGLGLRHYVERPTGPLEHGAVTVKALARLS